MLVRRLVALISQHRELPLPGRGETLSRFRVLAEIAEEDLSLAKLFESHADAHAIMHELGASELIERDQRWAVWCAEPPSHRLNFTRSGSGTVRIDGSKAFASGFVFLTHALVSGYGAEGERLLAAIDLSDSRLAPISGGFYAAGMSATETVDLEFDGVRGLVIGAPSAYLDRPGFLYGAAGVAACWFGGARAILRLAHRILEERGSGAPKEAEPSAETISITDARRAQLAHQLAHQRAHLGILDLMASAAAFALREAAAAIDAEAGLPPRIEIMRARLAIENLSEELITRVPRLAGAGPLCRDIALDRILNDLRIYIRQSHAERDLEAHGAALSALEGSSLWRL